MRIKVGWPHFHRFSGMCRISLHPGASEIVSNLDAGGLPGLLRSIILMVGVLLTVVAMNLCKEFVLYTYICCTSNSLGFSQ